jgi:hypothetical protein
MPLRGRGVKERVTCLITDKITDITLGKEKEAYADLQPKKFC